jgi:hypothetical protein
LDKFARYYAWFLLVATALPALVRLAQPVKFAQLTSERMAGERKRARHRMWGWVSLIGSWVLIPAYLFYSRQGWMLAAFAIGILTGMEMIGNAKSPEEQSLARQNRYFGAAYAVAAAATWFFLIHQ